MQNLEPLVLVDLAEEVIQTSGFVFVLLDHSR